MTVVSQIIGSKNFKNLYPAFLPGTVLAIIAVLSLSINLLIFPDWTFHALFPTVNLESNVIKTILTGVWFCSTFYIFSYLPVSYILAFKDTTFTLFMGLMNWITGYCFIYIFMELYNFPPQYFWLLLSFLYISMAVFYFLRTRWLIGKLKLNFLHT